MILVTWIITNSFKYRAFVDMVAKVAITIAGFKLGQ
jgi:hypothetical protein